MTKMTMTRKVKAGKFLSTKSKVSVRYHTNQVYKFGDVNLSKHQTGHQKRHNVIIRNVC